MEAQANLIAALATLALVLVQMVQSAVRHGRLMEQVRDLCGRVSELEALHPRRGIHNELAHKDNGGPRDRP